MKNGIVALAALVAAATGCTAHEEGIAGTWEGYVADQGRLQSYGVSSDRIAVQVTEVAENGSITGKVSFGEPGTMAPVTDPNDGYPTEFHLEQGYGPWPFIEKFSYGLTGSFDEANRRLLGARNPNEVWTDWCEMQTVYESSGGYGCLPACGSVQTDDVCELLGESCDYVEVDCGQLALCGGISAVCQCGPGGCTAAGGPQIVFDLRLEGDELHGQIVGLGETFLVRQ